MQGGNMSHVDLATIAGYTAYWYPDNHDVHIELTLIDGERKSLGKVEYAEATALLTMLAKDGKKSTSYMDGKYIQVSESYKFR